MSGPQRVRGVRILKAVSSPLRLQILNLLFDEGALSYTELMSCLKMNPSRDAGRFAYHLKFLLRADLLEADVEARKYLLSDLGKMVIDVADKIDKKAFKHKSTLVRTSRPALEEFDVNKIAHSLVKEAQMPVELAQKVAKEAEKQLVHSKTKYLTAPLVREVVNAILIEKGFEEYRNKLTRLGIPVHDVMSLLDLKRNDGFQKSVSIHELAGKTVFREYALLNIFPRDISDAHLSGALHVNGLSSWILKPREISHDLRFFFEKGLDLGRTDPFRLKFPQPFDLESALNLTFNVCLHTANEVETSQILPYFNVLLAPFAKDTEPARAKDLVRLFVRNLAQQIDVSLGLELTVPDFLARRTAVGANGNRVGCYSDFLEQTQLLARLLLDVFVEESRNGPFVKPGLILNIRTESLVDERAKALLLKSLGLAAVTGAPCFANLTQKNRKHSVFSSGGSKLVVDVGGDWETDTLRTGCLGTVVLNVPRVVYEFGKDKPKIVEALEERIEMSNRALEIKYRALKSRGKRLLPFIQQGSDGDQYFRVDDCSRIVNLLGLEEAATAFSGKAVSDEGTLGFVSEVVEGVSGCVRRMGRRRGKSVSLAMIPSFEASQRLAQADIEKYGVAKVKLSGTRERPFYSAFAGFAWKGDALPQEYEVVQSKLVGAHEGGSLTVVDLGEGQHEPPELMALTNMLIEADVEFWVYDRKQTCCVSCRKTWFGSLRKCPSCGAVGTLAVFDRVAWT